jgi:Sulfotransferase domain
MSALTRGSRVPLYERARIRLRVGTSRLLRLRPTFLVLGAQKSGTTALHRYLEMHDEVLCARIKEVDYFDHNYALGDGWYLSHFPYGWRRHLVRHRVGADPAVGELSPDYLLDPRVPERVHRFDPTLRLVVLLRDPVERAYSHYDHERRLGREPLSFQEALEQEGERLEPEFERMWNEPAYSSPAVRNYSYLARGRYAEQLERWLAVFPREQLLILESRRLREQTAACMAEICSFVGVSPPRVDGYPEVGRTTYTAPLAARTREWLARYFEPYNERLYALLGRDLGWLRPAALDEGAAAVDVRVTSPGS